MNIISNYKLIIAGDGWGAVSALKSLQKQFNCYVISSDINLVQLVKQDKIISNFEDVDYDIVILAGYKPIIPESLAKSGKFLNIHYSLLPQYRGLHSTVWAIINNETYLGISIHIVNEFVDDGDLIFQFKVKNDFFSSSSFYMKTFNTYIEKNLSEIVRKYLIGELIPIKQDKKRASWVGKRTLNDCCIDVSKPIDYQKAFFRALVFPYPRPFFYYKKEKYEIISFMFHSIKIDTHIGRILNVDDEGIWVKIIDGYIILTSVINKDGVLMNNKYFKVGTYIND